jgi:hypothetical protein
MSKDQTEEDIIAEAFVLIKEGILTLNWEAILDGYEMISGERLELPEKPKSKLEKIREKLNKKEPSADKKKIDKKKTSESSEDQGIVETKSGNVTIISSIEIPEEKIDNMKASKMTPKSKKKRDTEISKLDNSNKDSGFRIHVNPKIG